MGGCRLGDVERQAGVIGSGVEVQVGARQPIQACRRHVLERLIGREPLVELSDAKAARQVVHPHRRAESAGDLARHDAVLREDGDHERQDAHEMGGVSPQPVPLTQGLVHEPDVTLLQVAKAAVHELRALGRRAGGEVVALDECRSQPSGGGVERHAGASDATAHDDHVELVRRSQVVEHRRTLERGGLTHQGRSLRLIAATFVAAKLYWRSAGQWF